MSDVSYNMRLRVARKVLSAMRRARQPDTYGSSYANSMNEEISREVADDIMGLINDAVGSSLEPQK